MCIQGVYIPNLYWRLKVNGKWSWQRVEIESFGSWGFTLKDPNGKENINFDINTPQAEKILD
jgi:predicted membrane-bound spermidine synthase